MRRVCIALVLIVAACGGGGGSKTDTASDATTTTAKGDVPVTASASTGVSAAGQSSSSTTNAGAVTSTTAKSPAKAATTDGPAPVPAGTYRYKQSGSATVNAQKYDSPPEGTMVAKPAGADGKQLLQRYIDPKGDPSDTTMQFRADGMFMLETVLRQGGQEIRCTFDEPMPAPTWPPKVGAAASGHANCGSFQTDVASKITGTKPVTVDGVAYTAYVVESTITTTGGVTSKSTQVDWFVPELRLSAHTESSGKGKFGTFEFSSEGTSDLVSAKPE